ncbi:hypothetical protein BJX64DRAFT_271122 [Aspergillus heterothallicus]
MKSHGNTIVNKIYNPRNVQPPVPADIDEADACMERFIRQKYQTRTLEDGRPKPPSRQDPSYTTRLPEGSPPPLPPKPSRPFGFGLRSASSATNLSRQSASSRGPESPVSDSRRSSFETKLTRLREMGFTNERRNATALRSLDGNLEKTIETLVRVGEGKQTPQVRTPAATTSGATVNPFDQLDSKPSVQPSQPSQPGLSFNPFDMPTTQAQLQPQVAPTQSLEQSFQNLQVAQPLFPHSTGGYPNRQTTQSQPIYGQFAAPFAAPQAGFVSSPQPLEGANNPFFQTGAQPQASLSTPPPQNPYTTQNNPFFSQIPPQAPQILLQNQNPAVAFPPPRHANTMPPMSTSPFGQPAPFQQPQPQQQLQQPQLGLQTAQPGQNAFNPFQSMTAPNTPLTGGYSSQSPFGYPSTAQTLAPQPTGRVDKNSILALYNFSSPPPAIPEQQQSQQVAAPAQGLPLGQLQNPQAAFAPPDFTNAQPQPQLDLNAQAAASRNPFGFPGPSGAQQLQTQIPAQTATYGMAMNSANAGASAAFMRSHMSQQSVDINGFQSGRHSPDAFASLSSRSGR